MSGNYSVNVPKLKGRENYDDWAFAAENFMILEGVDVTSTTGLTEAENKKARAKILARCLLHNISLKVQLPTPSVISDIKADGSEGTLLATVKAEN